MTTLVAPSVLAANFIDLQSDLAMINASAADYLHVDIMDGVFVPNISFGQNIVQQIAKHCEKPLDVHLMITQPDRYLESFKDAGADILTVHLEACDHLHRTVHYIREMGIKAGVALNPHTPVESLFDILDDIDLVCLMSVNPGFGGQKFIFNTLKKIKALRTEITSRNLNCHIEIDGGVGLQNAEAIVSAGADLLVAGSAVFKSPDPAQTIDQLKAIQLGGAVGF